MATLIRKVGLSKFDHSLLFSSILLTLIILFKSRLIIPFMFFLILIIRIEHSIVDKLSWTWGKMRRSSFFGSIKNYVTELTKCVSGFRRGLFNRLGSYNWGWSWGWSCNCDRWSLFNLKKTIIHMYIQKYVRLSFSYCKSKYICKYF